MPRRTTGADERGGGMRGAQKPDSGDLQPWWPSVPRGHGGTLGRAGQGVVLAREHGAALTAGRKQWRP
jgi:hypothetical protein